MTSAAAAAKIGNIHPSQRMNPSQRMTCLLRVGHLFPLSHCVTQAAAEGGDAATAKVREASDAIARLVRS